MAKKSTSSNKVVLNTKKQGKAKKHPNKKQTNKPYRSQGR